MRKATLQRAYIKAALCSAALLPVCASCVYDDYADATAGGDNTVNVGITIRTASMAATRSDDYEKGSNYENYIDLTGEDYRIYFFTNNADDGNDTYITTFTPLDIYANSGKDYTEYTLYGTVPDDMVSEEGYTNFKIMVLANWGTENYPDDEKLTDATIDDVCDYATFSAFVGSEENDDGSYNAVMPSTANRIPFYGIHAYNVTFKQGSVVMLPKPVTLLRAMAKVEVVLQSEDYSFSSVTLQRYNAQGYCAPTGVYSEDKYESADGNTSNLSGVHLVGDANDSNEKDAEGNNKPIERSISFQQADDETWVAYVPEYRNTDTDNPNDYAYIKVTVNNDNSDTYEIYFANYTVGTTDNSDVAYRFDIQRNSLYRYVVEILDDEKLNVHVDKWSDVYYNDFVFDTDSSEDEEGDGSVEDDEGDGNGGDGD